MSAFIIFRNEITDADGYASYLEAAGGSLEPFDGRVVVFAEDTDVLEGDPGFERCVVLEFPDRASAEGWYRSDHYQRALPLRLKSAPGWAFIVDGVASS